MPTRSPRRPFLYRFARFSVLSVNEKQFDAFGTPRDRDAGVIAERT